MSKTSLVYTGCPECKGIRYKKRNTKTVECLRCGFVRKMKVMR